MVVNLVFVESWITVCWQHLTMGVDIDSMSLSCLQDDIQVMHVMSCY